VSFCLTPGTTRDSLSAAHQGALSAKD